MSYHGYCLTWQVQFCWCWGWWLHVFIVDALILDFCKKISSAISVECVMILFSRSIKLSRGDITILEDGFVALFWFYVDKVLELNYFFLCTFPTMFGDYYSGFFLCIFSYRTISCSHGVCGVLGRGTSGIVVFDMLCNMGWFLRFGLCFVM